MAKKRDVNHKKENKRFENWRNFDIFCENSEMVFVQEALNYFEGLEQEAQCLLLDLMTTDCQLVIKELVVYTR